MPAIRSRSRRATTSRAPTKSAFSTSRRAPMSATSCCTSSRRSPSACSSRSRWAAACASSRTFGGCSTPEPTRSRSTPPRCRTRNWSERLQASSAINASSSRSTRKGMARAGRFIPTAGASPPAWTPCNGRGACRPRGRGKSCSPAWTATARATDSTSRSRAPCRTRSACRSSPPAASAASSTSLKASSKGMPMPCWRPASSILANSPCARRRSTCGAAASRSAYERMARRGAVERAGADSRRRAGFFFGQGADRRVDEPRSAGKNSGGPGSRLLVALAQEAMAKGRAIRPRAKAARSAHRLRRGCPAAQGGAGGRHCLPYRPRELLLQKTAEREVGGDRSGAEGSVADLQKMKPGLYATLERIAATIEERKHGDVKTSYVARLLSQGEDALLKKIGEEATETVLAAKSGDRLHLVRETADLWFHCMIVLARHGLGPGDVLAFHDIRPQAAVHFLIVPKEHLPSLYEAGMSQLRPLGKMLALAGELARNEGAADGFRAIINTGRVGHQEVYHLHMHVLGGPEPLGPMLQRRKEETRMGSFSIWHWLIVLVIVMLIFGTKKLRNIGADLGGAVRGFKDGMREGGDKAAEAGAAPQVTGKTIEGEVKEKTEQKA